MPLFRLRAIAEQSTNVSADNISWGFGVEAATAPTSGVLASLRAVFEDALEAETGAGDSLGDFIQSGLDFTLLEAYPAAGGEATGVSSWPTPYRPNNTGAAAMPSEVALVLSQRVTTVRGARPVGRTYLGPFTTAVSSGGRPSQAVIDAALAFADFWHDGLTGVGLTPVVINAAGSASRGPIVGYAVDNAWDSQRRRGWDRTAITAITV